MKRVDYLDIALYSMIWFYIGYIIHKNNLLQTIINNKIVITICFFIWLIGAQFVDVGIASRRYINSYIYFLPILIATAGVFSVIWISKKLENTSIFFKKCGEKSMYFLATYYLTTSYINAFISNNTTKIIIELIVSYLGAILIDKMRIIFKNMYTCYWINHE